MSPGLPGALAAPLLLLLPLLSLASSGCNESEPPPAGCTTVFGDPSKPIRVIPGQFKNEQSFEVLGEGDTLDLRFPTQGGQVAYVGARVTNIVACDVQVSAVVRDQASGRQIAKEQRTVKLVPSAVAEGYGEPETDNPANFSNVPMCPNYVSPAFLGVDTVLEVTVTERIFDAAGVPTTREGTATLTVRPECNEQGSPEADANRVLCACECQPDYCLGRCSEPEQGPGECVQ